MAAVRRDDLVQTKTISCRSRPIREQSYSFPVGGIYVDRIYVSVGDSVSAGDILAELERKDILTQVEEAKIAVRKQEFALDLARDDTALRREAFYLELFTGEPVNLVEMAANSAMDTVADEADAADEAVDVDDVDTTDVTEAADEVNSNDGDAMDEATVDVDDADSAADEPAGDFVDTVDDAVDTAEDDHARQEEIRVRKAYFERPYEDYKFRVAYAERQLEIAQRKLNTLEEIADERVIYAGIDGVVSYAQRFQPQDRSVADDKVFTISDASELIYTVMGDEVQFFTPGVVYSMKISKAFLEMRAVSPEEFGEPETKTPVMYFFPEDLTAGLATYGYITVEVNRRDNVLYLPSAAIIQVGEEFAVYRVGESGFRELAPVEIGITISGKTEIQSGLSEGDEVILD